MASGDMIKSSRAYEGLVMALLTAAYKYWVFKKKNKNNSPVIRALKLTCTISADLGKVS